MFFNHREFLDIVHQIHRVFLRSRIAISFFYMKSSRVVENSRRSFFSAMQRRTQIKIWSRSGTGGIFRFPLYDPRMSKSPTACDTEPKENQRVLILIHMCKY